MNKLIMEFYLYIYIKIMEFYLLCRVNWALQLYYMRSLLIYTEWRC